MTLAIGRDRKRIPDAVSEALTGSEHQRKVNRRPRSIRPAGICRQGDRSDDSGDRYETDRHQRTLKSANAIRRHHGRLERDARAWYRAPLEPGDQVVTRRRSVRGQFLERCHDRCAHMRWHARPNHSQVPRPLGEHACDDRLRRRACVRWLAREHLVHHGAERIDVGAGVERTVARRLLRRHVLRCTEREPGLRDALPTGVAQRERNAEIGDQRLAVVKQNVLGFEIAMDHAAAVRIVQRAADRDGEPDRVADRKLFLTIQPRTQRLAFDERHDIEQQAARCARIEQREQVRVLQVRRDFDFGEKTLGTKHRAELRIEHLECDAPVMSDVAGEKDGGHTAAANLAFHLITAGERVLKLIEKLHHVQLPEQRRDGTGYRSPKYPRASISVYRAVSGSAHDHPLAPHDTWDSRPLGELEYQIVLAWLARIEGGVGCLSYVEPYRRRAFGPLFVRKVSAILRNRAPSYQ